MEGLIIPPHERQAKRECVVAETGLQGAIQWGRDMGGCWLGWVRTHTQIACHYSQHKMCVPQTHWGYS